MDLLDDQEMNYPGGCGGCFRTIVACLCTSRKWVKDDSTSKEREAEIVTLLLPLLASRSLVGRGEV